MSKVTVEYSLLIIQEDDSETRERITRSQAEKIDPKFVSEVQRSERKLRSEQRVSYLTRPKVWGDKPRAYFVFEGREKDIPGLTVVRVVARVEFPASWVDETDGDFMIGLGPTLVNLRELRAQTQTKCPPST